MTITVGTTHAPPDVRFWRQVGDHSNQTNCWLWESHKDRRGYGLFHLAKGRTVQVHRYAYQSLVGPIPEGLVIDHLCRTRACVNPAHMEPVMPAENTRRGLSAQPRLVQCREGHPFDEANTVYKTNGPNRRRTRNCRICVAAYAREYRSRKAAAA